MSPRSCARLLAKLVIHHPELAPPALLRLVSSRPPPAPPPPPPPPAPAPPPRAAKPTPGRPLSVHDVIDMVAWFYELTPRDLRFGGRFRLFSHPRFVAFYLARSLIRDGLGQQLSVSAIARRFGFDHTSILNGLNNIDAAISADERLRDEIEIIRLHLRGETHDQSGRIPSSDFEQARGISGSRLSEYIRYRNSTRTLSPSGPRR